MGEKTGFLFCLVIFSAILLPLGLSFWQQDIKSKQFMSATTDIKKLVEEEGGVTPKVAKLQSELDKRGLEVVFVDENNHILTGKQPVGKKVIIQYKYIHKNNWTETEFSTSNYVVVNKR